MQLAVVGAGPAGLTAAYRLQQAGHQVEILEALQVVGGRTHTEHFGAGHHCDTGAGWLATFYSHTLRLFDELGLRDLFVRPRAVRGAADLLIDGQIYPWSYLPDGLATSPLLTPEDLSRYTAYLARLRTEQPADLRPDLAADQRSALDELRPLGERVVEIVMRSLFEGPWFARLGAQWAAHARLWLRVLQEAHFFQLKDGMDAPWLRIATGLPVRTGERVEALHRRGNGVELTCASGGRRYDGVVLATPSPAALRILATQPDLAPSWLSEVQYAPQVHVYAARQTTEDAHFGVHVLPPTDLFSVEWYAGRHGAWGACPPDWQWALVCAYGPTCARFLQQEAERCNKISGRRPTLICPQLFTLAEADVVHYMGWEWAVPIMHPGHYRNLATFVNQPPVVLAGDWMNNACVEGAVRSGEAAPPPLGQPRSASLLGQAR